MQSSPVVEGPPNWEVCLEREALEAASSAEVAVRQEVEEGEARGQRGEAHTEAPAAAVSAAEGVGASDEGRLQQDLRQHPRARALPLGEVSAMPHFCYTVYWGSAAVDLVNQLDAIAPGDVRRMKQHTYWTLCALQREIERATGFPQAPILGHLGPPPAPIADDQEALLRATAQQFLNGLVSDQFDSVGPANHSGKFLQPFWMTDGVAEMNAIVTLVGSVPPFVVPPPMTSVLGRIRAALGS
jgi:hypothetical protein